MAGDSEPIPTFEDLNLLKISKLTFRPYVKYSTVAVSARWRHAKIQVELQFGKCKDPLQEYDLFVERYDS